MADIEKQVEHAFDKAEKVEKGWGRHWRRHVNRRTLWVIGLLALTAIPAYIYLIEPPDSFPTRELVTVAEGSSLRDVARTLKQEGVIRNETAFRFVVTALGHQRSIVAGDYMFAQPVSVLSVARALSYGWYGLEPVRIRIPEGSTVARMARVYAFMLPRVDEAAFLSEASPMEGYLFPDTYFFLPSATSGVVIRTMRETFDTKTEAIRLEAASSGRSMDDVVKMASILEKEAYSTEDRRKISGVLWNRIAKGMPLQADPTVQYVIPKGDFELTKADLRHTSPYNTYVHKGFPPTPIDSPSLDSLEAAIHPFKSENLFYLADRRGVTHYSKTYQQHLRYKAMYLGR